MSCYYFAEQQMARQYWYYANSRSTSILNVCAGKLTWRLATPHEILYIKKLEAWTWYPLSSIGYFHHQKYGTITRSSTQKQTLVCVEIGLTKNSNVMNFYNPVTRIIYTTRDYALGPGGQTNTHFGLKYYRVILVGTYSSYSDTSPKIYPLVTQARYCLTKSEPVQGTVYSIPPHVPLQSRYFQSQVGFPPRA